MLRSVVKQSVESVESVLKKKRKATASYAEGCASDFKMLQNM